MKYISAIMISLFLLACNNSPAKAKKEVPDTTFAAVHDTLTEQSPGPTIDLITDTLMKLPFIVESNRHIDSFTQHQQGIAFLSDTAEGLISIRAGYHGQKRFETFYHLAIDLKTRQIKILDPVVGNYITLEEYNKNLAARNL
jgi:hypothetical protein